MSSTLPNLNLLKHSAKFHNLVYRNSPELIPNWGLFRCRKWLLVNSKSITCEFRIDYCIMYIFWSFTSLDLWGFLQVEMPTVHRRTKECNNSAPQPHIWTPIGARVVNVVFTITVSIRRRVVSSPISWKSNAQKMQLCPTPQNQMGFEDQLCKLVMFLNKKTLD
jgi:hypothetical protein